MHRKGFVPAVSEEYYQAVDDIALEQRNGGSRGFSGDGQGGMQILKIAVQVGHQDQVRKVLEDHADSPQIMREFFEFIIEARNLNFLKAFVRAGGNLDYCEGDSKCLFEMVFSAWNKNSDEKLFDIMKFIAKYMNTHRCLELIEEFATQRDFEPDELKDLCRKTVSGSDFPITTALQVAHFMEKIAKVQVVEEEAFDELSVYFTETASRLLNETELDHFAALIVEGYDSHKNTPLDVALKSKNLRFLADARITRIMNAMWRRPYFVAGPKNFSAEDDLLKPLKYPRDFHRFPKGKYIIEVVSFVAFLFVFSAVTYDHSCLDNSTANIEVAMWCFVAAFGAHELVEIRDMGLPVYFEDGWNILDFTIYTIFLITAIVRGLIKLGVDAGGNCDHILHFDTAELGAPAVITIFAFSINAVLLWLRLSYIFIVHPSVGPLLRIMKRILLDVSDFLILSFNVIIGFAFAMRFLLSGSESYGGLDGAAYSLFKALLGDFDFGDLFEVDDEDDEVSSDIQSSAIGIIAQMFFCAYLTLAVIILLNLLIAMMSDTYAHIRARASNEYLYAFAETVRRKDRERNVMPPPFNVLVKFIYYCWVLLVKMRSCCCKVEQEQAAKSFGWRCGLCHYKNSRKFAEDDPEERTRRKQLIKDMEIFPKEDADDYVNDDGERDTYVQITREDVPESEFDKLSTFDVCEYCFRVKTGISENEHMEQIISEMIFKLFFWPVLLLLMFIPFGIKSVLHRQRHYIVKKEEFVGPNVGDVLVAGDIADIKDHTVWTNVSKVGRMGPDDFKEYPGAQFDDEDEDRWDEVFDRDPGTIAEVGECVREIGEHVLELDKKLRRLQRHLGGAHGRGQREEAGDSISSTGREILRGVSSPT